MGGGAGTIGFKRKKVRYCIFAKMKKGWTIFAKMFAHMKMLVKTKSKKLSILRKWKKDFVQTLGGASFNDSYKRVVFFKSFVP